ncbi:MAG TPA: S9 family peptidase [bacterium]|nr:S9 family peptidase [bacterium]HPN35182.1 S9 family peptidase [bacterium]
MRNIRIALTALLLFSLGSVFTLTAQKKKLTYSLSSGRAGDPRLLTPLPLIEGWLDNEHYLVRENRKPDGRILAVSVTDGQSTVWLDPDSLNKKLPQGFDVSSSLQHSADYVHFLFSKDQDLYYFNAQRGLFKRLTQSAAAEETPHFSPDHRRVAFTREHDLYVVAIDSGEETRITDDGAELILNGIHSWVYYEEVYNRARRGFWWSPAGDRLAFVRYDDSSVPEFSLFCADSVHGSWETARYPKAGDANPKVALGVANLADGRITWMNLEADEDHYIAHPIWSHDGRALYFQWLNRGQDHLKLYRADPANGGCSVVYEERQPAWVEFFEDMQLLENGTGFLLRSDKSGWPHLYHYDLRGRLRRQLTSGEWAVKRIEQVDEKRGWVYFSAGRPVGTETQLFRVGLKAGPLQQLTHSPGAHSVRLSPDSRFFIDTWSNIAQPAKMELVVTGGKPVCTLAEANSPQLAEYELGRVTLFSIPTGDGFFLPAVWVLPADLDSSKKYPVLISVYGGPAAATVSNSWQALRNHYYAQNGIIWLSVDHRGSGHFGKKGAALMHRRLGHWEMNDYIETVKWLRRQPFVDSTRIAITGGSYGGYVTCLALTRGAGYFTHGIAEFPVTDFRLYDSIYTERYMDAPAENRSGYDSTSVMTWAERYHGLLRITHGTLDDNVHMQNTLQLIAALQDRNRHFEMMIYPGSRHGYGPAKGRHSGQESMRFWFRQLLDREWTAD